MRVLVWLFVIAVAGLVVSETISAVLTHTAVGRPAANTSEGTPFRPIPLFEQ